MLNREIALLAGGQDLDTDSCIRVAREIMKGEVPEDQIASFLINMKEKGETSSEIASFAKVMREFCTSIEPKVNGILVDTCGTGGDGLNTFNISTASAFVAAGTGVQIAKHGNRSVSSNCGSADILEAAGIGVELPPGQVKESIEELGIGFMYAPLFHPAMRHVQPVRRKLGIRTIFNILGPLTNPANAEAQVIGVYSPDLVKKVAGALVEIGIQRAVVVHGSGLDEITNTGVTSIAEVAGTQISEYELNPKDLGMAKASMNDLVSGDLEASIKDLIDVLEGKPGPKLDIVLMNAGAAIMVGGLASDLNQGIGLARESIISGKALDKLNSMKMISKDHGGSE